MSNDTIREVHGVACVEGSFHARLTLSENESTVCVQSTAGSQGVQLTVDQARYVALKLYRLSRRLRVRKDASENLTS